MRDYYSVTERPMVKLMAIHLMMVIDSHLDSVKHWDSMTGISSLTVRGTDLVNSKATHWRWGKSTDSLNWMVREMPTETMMRWDCYWERRWLKVKWKR